MKQQKLYIFKIEKIKLKTEGRMIFNFIKKLLVAFCLSCFIAQSSMATEKEAANFINDLASRVIALIKNTSISDQEKENQLNSIFLKSVDTLWIGQFAMGRYWRTLDPTQKSQYIDLYRNYLTGLYVPNFRKYTGNVIKITGSKEVRPNEYLVQTLLTDSSNSLNIRIDYQLIQKSGLENFVIFDIVAEGVSLITSQRAEINSAMQQGDFNSLIALLVKKTNGTKK